MQRTALRHRSCRALAVEDPMAMDLRAALLLMLQSLHLIRELAELLRDLRCVIAPSQFDHTVDPHAKL